MAAFDRFFVPPRKAPLPGDTVKNAWVESRDEAETVIHLHGLLRSCGEEIRQLLGGERIGLDGSIQRVNNLGAFLHCAQLHNLVLACRDVIDIVTGGNSPLRRMQRDLPLEPNYKEVDHLSTLYRSMALYCSNTQNGMVHQVELQSFIDALRRKKSEREIVFGKVSAYGIPAGLLHVEYWTKPKGQDRIMLDLSLPPNSEELLEFYAKETLNEQPMQKKTVTHT